MSRGLPPAQDSYAFTFHAISVGTYAHVHDVDILYQLTFLELCQMSSVAFKHSARVVELETQEISLNERMTVAFKGNRYHSFIIARFLYLELGQPLILTFSSFYLDFEAIPLSYLHLYLPQYYHRSLSITHYSSSPALYLILKTDTWLLFLTSVLN